MRFRTMLPAAALVASLVAALGTAAFAVTIDKGAVLQGNLQNQISSKDAKDGDTFTVTLTGATDTNGNPVHGTISGHLSEVVRSTYTHKAHMKLNFDRLTLTDGTSAPIDAALVSIDKKQHTDAVRAITEVVGANILGNYIGKHIGTNLGGIVGTGAGILYAANTASDVVLPQNANVKVSVNSTLVTRRQASSH